jgi:hypothetical protein
MYNVNVSVVVHFEGINFSRSQFQKIKPTCAMIALRCIETDSDATMNSVVDFTKHLPLLIGNRYNISSDPISFILPLRSDDVSYIDQSSTTFDFILTSRIRNTSPFLHAMTDMVGSVVKIMNAPYIEELLSNSIPDDYNILTLLFTCSYLNIDTKELIKSLVYKIMSEKKYFDEWFTKSKTIDGIDHFVVNFNNGSSVEDKYRRVVTQELQSLFPGSNSRHAIGIRFDNEPMGIQLPQIISSGNVELFEYFWNSKHAYTSERYRIISICIRKAIEERNSKFLNYFIKKGLIEEESDSIIHDYVRSSDHESLAYLFCICNNLTIDLDFVSQSMDHDDKWGPYRNVEELCIRELLESYPNIDVYKILLQNSYNIQLNLMTAYSNCSNKDSEVAQYIMNLDSEIQYIQ